jgi:uncharacterized membrane protein
MHEPTGLHHHLMSAFERVCGQNPATSPFLLGYQSPLCYRCLGIYLAFACALVVRRRVAPTLRRSLSHLALAIAALAILALDVFLFQRLAPNNATRLCTGIMAGWSLGLVFGDSLRVLWAPHSLST